MVGCAPTATSTPSAARSRAGVSTSSTRPTTAGAPAVEQRHAIAPLRRQVEIVHHHDDGGAGALLGGEQLEQLELMAHVERRRRLVEHQGRRLLRQRPRQQHALALAARQLAERARRQLEDAGVGHGALGGGDVGGGLEAERAEPRASAHEHDLERRERELERLVLQHGGDQARALARRQRREIALVDGDLAGRRRQQAEQEARQRRLAGAVGAEDADELAAPDIEVDVDEERRP